MGKWNHQQRSPQPGGWKNRGEEWPYEREGYSDTQAQVAYAAAPAARVAPNNKGRLETFIGSLMAGGGAIWAAQVASASGFNPSALTLNSHPIELTGIGILIWLHGKYRKATQVR
jgi:hypothetical protein